MNQEKLKQRLVELLEESFEKQYDKRGLITATHTAEDIIANGVTIREWIPASEPPEKSGIYQVFVYDEDMERNKVWYGQFVSPDHWFVYNIYGDCVRCKVTHWMPLPEPPETEKGDEGK